MKEITLTENEMNISNPYLKDYSSLLKIIDLTDFEEE